MDLGGAVVHAHSNKQDAAPTGRRTYGHHPLLEFVDHGPGGTGKLVAAPLRPGNAGSNTVAGRITTTRLALARLHQRYRRGRRTLVRTDPGGAPTSSWPGSRSGAGGCPTRSAKQTAGPRATRRD